MLKLNGMAYMMQANATSNEVDRVTLQKQAYAAYAESELLQPIGASPVSDLVMFALLERKFGRSDKLPDLLRRIQTVPEIDLYATERALSVILMAEEDTALREIEDLAQQGLLNIPLLRELGLLGQNRALFGTFGKHTRFEQAVAQQELINQELRSRALTEYPKILNPKP